MSATSPEQIKAESEQWILNAGGTILDSLPWIGMGELSLRDKDDIARRALVLHILVNISFGAPLKFCKDWLQRYALLGAVSQKELQALSSSETLDEKTQSMLRWNIESLQTAAWIGGFTDDLTPTLAIPNSLASYFPNLRTGESPDRFLQEFTCRSLEEIYPVLDLFYRAHWHTTNCGLTGKDPSPMNHGIVHCRRKMLEWAAHAACDWDNVEMST
jgi:hypothetical protein